MTRSLLPLALIAWIPAAQAGLVDIESATASSVYPAEEGVRYDASQVIDGAAATAWVEGEDGSGLGSWIELDLGGEKKVTRIKIWGGLWYSYGYYQRANRPKEIELKYSDGSTETVSIPDEMKVLEHELSTPKTSSTVRLRIQSIYSGNTWLDTAISEVQVFDDRPDERVRPTSFAASSEAPADADGSYEGFKVDDGLKDTMWCEGSSGDGTGQWIEFRFPGAVEIDSLTIINGIGSDFKTWMKGNRAVKATLVYSDGSTEEIAVPKSLMPREVEIGPKTTSSVRIRFDEVEKGKEFNDLCISEAYFSK